MKSLNKTITALFSSMFLNKMFTPNDKNDRSLSLGGISLQRIAGDRVTYTMGIKNLSFDMIYLPGEITFPTGIDDSSSATVDNSYEIGKTEVTYALWKTVYTWAIANGFSQSTFDLQVGYQGYDDADDANIDVGFRFARTC
jgi:hypothetical protein